MQYVIIESTIPSKIGRGQTCRIKQSFMAIPISSDTLLAKYEGIFHAAYLNGKKLQVDRMLPRIFMVLLKHHNDKVYKLDKDVPPIAKYPFVCNKVEEGVYISNDTVRIGAPVQFIMEHGDIYYLGVVLIGNKVILSHNNYILINDIIISCDSYDVEIDGFAKNGSEYYPIDRIALPSTSTIVVERNKKKLSIKMDNIRAYDYESVEQYYWNGITFVNHPDPSIYLPIVNMYGVGCILKPIFSEDMSHNYLLSDNCFLYKVDDKVISSANDLVNAKKIALHYKSNIIIIYAS